MSAYVRPPLPRQVFRDADGKPFEYGERWGVGGPPEETYSHDSHPERFAPLHEVADALVEHLVATYDVELRTEPWDRAAERRWQDAARVVGLRPRASEAAPLTLVYTDYPGLLLEAGELTTFHFPNCGCDACDEPLAVQVDELEQHAFAVVEGRFAEWVRVGAARWEWHWIGLSDGEASGEGRSRMPWPTVWSVRRRLGSLPDGRWQPWPRR
ncbi:DUF6226 family protein [Georgenia alba]|uniref:DUF6226 family protein n=1 Tax=Georgenia alba TaxID=2233858 RepID=A0ABW2Q816_9MICO